MVVSGTCNREVTFRHLLEAFEATSFPGSFLYFEKVPWLRLVTCLCMPTEAAQRVGPQLNFVNILWGGECWAALRTVF